jgi:glutaredoxin
MILRPDGDTLKAVMGLVMYVKPNCPYCTAAREDLQARGEAYEERDATTDAGWKAELMDHTAGTGMVPTLVRDGKRIQVGFPPGRG